jgi:hypothetical protein
MKTNRWYSLTSLPLEQETMASKIAIIITATTVREYHLFVFMAYLFFC